MCGARIGIQNIEYKENEHQVCGASLALSWFLASLAHSSLPGVTENLAQTDFNVQVYLRTWQKLISMLTR